jgi:hypothetical protein
VRLIAACPATEINIGIAPDSTVTVVVVGLRFSPDSPDDFAHPPLMRTGFAIIDK